MVEKRNGDDKPANGISTHGWSAYPISVELLFRELANLEGKLSTRLDGMDKAVEIFKSDLVRFPTEVMKAVSNLRELQDEKFKSIDVQFRERDTRVEQTAINSKLAVDAALQAAKEAVSEQNRSSALSISKSETSTLKQIDQLGTIISANTKASDDKINDLKERLTLLEGKSQGAGTLWGYLVGAVGLVVAAAVAAFEFSNRR